MSEDVIEAFIANSGNSYSLSATDVDYLHKHGVSDAVVDYLLKTDPSVGSAPSELDNTGLIASSVASATNSPTPGSSTNDATKLAKFKAQLSPYGNWTDVPGYGMAWQPSSLDANWRPYFDGGHWAYSDEGWYWRTEYAWGDIVFHYGRWVVTPNGWFWVPGYEYAPSWVVWRHADREGYIGWAPLPPGAVLVNGRWVYRGVRVAQDFDFGLGPRDYAFVSYEGFWEHDLHPYLIEDALIADVFRRTHFENHFWWDHDRFINHGIDSAMVANWAHHEIHEAKAQDLRQEEERRNIDLRGQDLQAFRDSGKRPDSMAVIAGSAADGKGRANKVTTADATTLHKRQGGAKDASDVGARRGRQERDKEATEKAAKKTPALNTYKPEKEMGGERKGRGETPVTETKSAKKPVNAPREAEPPREEPRKVVERGEMERK